MTTGMELPLSDFTASQEDEFYLTPASTAQADSLEEPSCLCRHVLVEG